ncbi:MAG: zinc ribbon domain-containing protein [Gemmatimonadales bacterium]
MHADLVKLLDLQAKDAAVAEVEQRLRSIEDEVAELDRALQRGRDALDAARRAALDGARRRDELETKIENYRVLQERRRLRLEHVRNPKEASTLMAELDLAQSVMTKEENDWVRSAESVTQLEIKASEEERNLAVAEEAQAPERARIQERRAAAQAAHDAAAREREDSAARIDRQLRTRYDRLRSRTSIVVVPLAGGACGACHTSVPLNRRSQIKSGQVLDGCETCGAILYPQETAGSAG